MTVGLILAIAIFVTAILSAIGKCPLWVSTILIAIYLLLLHLPK